MKVGIIGYGYWGKNLVRNFTGSGSCTVKTVADLRSEQLELLSRNHPAIERTKDVNEIFNDGGIDAVAIATPVFAHYPLARKALESGKHVLIEKPMCSTSAQVLELINLALQKKKVLMVDHTFLYTSAVQKIKEVTVNGQIGDLKYFDSTRNNLGLFQSDINVLWDLASHDISILNYLQSDTPYSVQATGTCHTGNGIENIAYLTLNYSSGFIAHFNCSWTSPVKIRLMLIGGDKKMIVFNDLEPTEKIKIYDSGYDFQTYEDKYKVHVDYRVGDIFIPKISLKEALSSMVLDFIHSIINNSSPIADHSSGLAVVRILEASQTSIKNKGKEIIF